MLVCIGAGESVGTGGTAEPGAADDAAGGGPNCQPDVRPARHAAAAQCRGAHSPPPAPSPA